MSNKVILQVLMERGRMDQLRHVAETQNLSMSGIAAALLDEFLDRLFTKPTDAPQCPAAEDDFRFCVHCPCPPLCQDWNCDACANREQGSCACWSRTLRNVAGWQSAYDQWKRGEAMADKAAKRIRAAKEKGFTHPWAWCQGSFARRG